MNGDYLQLDEDVINNFTSRFSKATMTIGDDGKNGKKQYSNLINSGIGGTAEVITDDMNQLSNVMNDFGMTFKKGTNQIFESDRIAAAEFQKIEVPTQFVVNEASETTKHVSIFRDKMDGKSVNNGVASTAFNEIADNTVNKAVLSDIRGADSTEEVYDSQSSIKGKSILGDIKRENTVEQTYTDAYTQQEKALKDINNNQTQQQEMKDGYTGKEKALKDINNNQTQQQEMKDNFMQNATALSGINTESTNQVYYDNSNLNEKMENTNEKLEENNKKTINERLAEFTPNANNAEKEKKEDNNEVIDVNYDKFF